MTSFAPLAPSTPTRALIVGAGDLGLALAARLVELGVDTTTLNRSGRATPGAASLRADLADPATLTDLPDCELVVFTTAPPGRDADAYRLAYVEGPSRVLAALPSVPHRLVLTSTTGVFGTADGSWVDESTEPAPTRATAAVVLEGEELLRAAGHSVVVRPAGIYGPGRSRLIDKVRAGDEAVATDGTARWTNRIHRDDLVEAMLIASLHLEAPPTLLAVDDEPAPRDDVIRFLAEQLGAPTPPTVDVDEVTGKRCRNDALRALGWRPRYPTYREGYDALLG